jgi:phenylacetic acid degradation operon negative regulatory protein
MRLGAKSRRFLDIVSLLGTDILKSLAHPKAALYLTSGWTSSRHFNESIEAMRNEGWIVWDDSRESASWVADLTKNGKDVAIDNIDPPTEWAKAWNGRWRTVSFDLPQTARKERRQLETWLKKRRFGHLQGSLWITHREYADWTGEIESRKIDPTAVLFQDSRPIGRNSGRDYVAKSWNFKAINRRYERYTAFLQTSPPPHASLAEFQNWFAEESKLWKNAFEKDPFLPNELLPRGYLGKSAWAERKETLTQFLKGISEKSSLFDE